MPDPRVAAERLGRHERLRRRVDYVRCYEQGRRRRGSFATLYFVPNHLCHPRIGITASRKVGNAVSRHRLRRRSREIYRRWPDRGSLPAVDFIVHLSPRSAKASFTELRRDLLNLLCGLSPRVSEHA